MLNQMLPKILIEEELKKIVIKTHNRVILHDDLDMVIKSHHLLLQSNAELSFKNMKLQEEIIKLKKEYRELLKEYVNG